MLASAVPGMVANTFAQNLVTNGSFELGEFTGEYFGNTYLEPPSTAIAGWTVIESDILWLMNDASDSQKFRTFASDGEYFLDLTGFDNLPYGGVEQTIATEIGGHYLLQFDLGSNPATVGPTQSVLAQAGEVQSTFTFHGSGDASQYTRLGFDFVAQSSATLLRLVGATPSGVNIGIDNVTVLLVPEPATWLIAFAGAAACLCHSRTRRLSLQT
jgi:hypothetical protein